MEIGIIGAGVAGLSCGKRLSSHGHRVRLFHKRRSGLVADDSGRCFAWDGEEILP